MNVYSGQLSHASTNQDSRAVIPHYVEQSTCLDWIGSESATKLILSSDLQELKAGETKIMAQQMGSGDLADLVQQMEQSEDDPRRCYVLVKQRISELRKSGRDVPDELSRLEKRVLRECMLASQGR
jgi:hypothetical protein